MNLINEKENYNDGVYEVLIKVSVPKSQGDTKSTVTEFLTDIRAITRVTIVDSLGSGEKNPFQKILNLKIKFNTKRLTPEMSPQGFIRDVLLPQIKKLDAHPIIKFVSRSRDHLGGYEPTG